MEKLNNFLKNVVIFTAAFLLINYVMQSCSNPEQQLATNAGNISFLTDDNEYSRRQTVSATIINNTSDTITIPNECPNEPLSVYRYQNNEWVQKSSSPTIDCKNAIEVNIATEQEYQFTYDNWNRELFAEMGRFRIEFPATINEEEKIITSNEFLIVEEGLIRKLWDGLFYRPIYNGLIFFASVVPGNALGWAIILLTLLIRTLVLIPSQKAMKSQKKMQDLQPRLEKIKQKFKGDQQRIAMETMAVWKEAKVSPAGSCLPMLMQFPFLIAVFYVVQSGLNPDQTFLLYSNYIAISDINVQFLGLNLTEANRYVPPLIIGGLQFIQMKLSLSFKKPGGKDDKNKKEMQVATNMMTYVLPVMIAVFTASLPAGVGIYWGTSTMYGIIQQLFVNRGSKGNDKPKDEPTVRVINS